LIIKGIASIRNERRYNQLQKKWAENEAQYIESDKKRHEKKQAEIAALPPVGRMTARIETGKSSVSLYLQLPERDRETVIQYGLDQVIFETYPRYNADDLRRMKLEGQREVEAIKGNSQDAMLKREFRQQDTASWNQRAKSEKVEVRLIDYMAYPYTRYFNTPLEVTQYAAKLKLILPKIKELVDQHAVHQASETIEL